MHASLKNLNDSSIVLQFSEVILMFLNSVTLGLILTLITVWATLKLAPQKKDGTQVQPLDIVLNSMMVLFLCFGMTGIMILVSNSLARAFAIGAAISLVRFRVRVDQPGFSAGLFFSVVTGMACGVEQIPVAWVLTLVFSAFQFAAVMLVKKHFHKEIVSTINISDDFSQVPVVTPEAATHQSLTN
ncbi:MAG: hypothetical protein HY072_05010 [Deltaproteobacteria bacterium]|nr:hypothetical protein [Deltaproteobacteria bacterium]